MARLIVKGFAALNFASQNKPLTISFRAKIPLPHRVTLGVLRIAIWVIGESGGVN